MKVGRQNICIRCLQIVENIACQHSDVADVGMAKGADEEIVNDREEILAKGFVRTVVLVEDFGSGCVGITEGINLRWVGSDGNIWCCTRI